MNKQAFNPYLPSWEYIPDAEPHVFGNRLYVYGSHDMFNGHVFCLDDYVCWSAPVTDLSDFRYEGVIYKKTADPLNKEGKMCLYAPDVTQGVDGRFYLYYVLDKVSVVSVAVSDTPSGKFEFYGYVHDENGDLLGERPGDEPQFDPAVITENNCTYLYTGFCSPEDMSRNGAMVTVLSEDMLTIKEEPRFVIPNVKRSSQTTFEGHEFFEASSIRKCGSTYYFVYSSVVMHELCYATSKSPVEGFVYGGVIVSNCDLHIDTYKPANVPSCYGANNHGGLVCVNGQWYIFYHRHTNGTWYSRQGCAEPIVIKDDGSIDQVEMTSCGLSHCILEGEGEYPAYIACNLYGKKPEVYVQGMDAPRISQDGRDGDRDPSYVMNITDGTTIGFKYFQCKGINKISIKTRGYASGVYNIKTSPRGEVLARIQVGYTNVWEEYESDINLPDGKHALYFTYEGQGNSTLLSFRLDK